MEKAVILVVDDDPRNIFALTAVLRAKSFRCISATGALEAIAVLKANSEVNAILLDMMMPEMDGYEAIPLIKSIPAHTNTLLVAVTAQAMVGDREKCLEAGADAYISKPVDVDKLLQLLRSL